MPAELRCEVFGRNLSLIFAKSDEENLVEFMVEDFSSCQEFL